MKDILIISNYIHFSNEPGNNRFIYLANGLKKEGYSVEIITSTFYHKSKKHREFSGEDISNDVYKVTLLYEPGYKKNISFKRLASIKVFAKNLIKYLETRKRPDVIYCAFPPIDMGKEVAKFAKKNNIPFIIDIQDLWPEAFKMVVKIPIINDLMFLPMKKSADFIFKSANAIVAVSQTYINRALSVNKSLKSGLSVFLGTELDYFDKVKETGSKPIKPSDEIWIAYIGTLGNSYDINLISKAVSILENRGINNLKFIIMGDGPKREVFQKYAEELKINCEFTGMLKYDDMIKILTKCDIAVNPIVKGAAGSVINKVGDYSAAGLPIVNTQENKEYRSYVEKYDIGINCRCENLEDVVNAIELLCFDSNLRMIKARNSRKLAEEKFDRKKTYKEIISVINSVCGIKEENHDG